MSKERGMNIQDAVNDMRRAEHYRKNEGFRNMRFRQKMKKADTEATVTTSSGLSEKKPLSDYTIETEECQDVKSDTPGDTSGGEIRKQGQTELPVHLL